MKNKFHTISITNLLDEKFVMQGNFVMSSIKISVNWQHKESKLVLSSYENWLQAFADYQFKYITI
jgi:hypothetical protein